MKLASAVTPPKPDERRVVVYQEHSIAALGTMAASDRRAWVESSGLSGWDRPGKACSPGTYLEYSWMLATNHHCIRRRYLVPLWCSPGKSSRRQLECNRAGRLGWVWFALSRTAGWFERRTHGMTAERSLPGTDTSRPRPRAKSHPDYRPNKSAW